MNCRQFTSHIVELARGQMPETGALDSSNRSSSALRHAESCRACAARLERERQLTAALRTVTDAMSECAAPASLEATLLAAFRERAGTSNAAVSNGATSNATTATASAASPVAATTNLTSAPVSLDEHVARKRSQQASLWSRHPAVAACAALAASLILVAFAAFSALRTQPRAVSANNRIASSESGSTSPSSPTGASAVPTVPTREKMTSTGSKAVESQTSGEVASPTVGRNGIVRASLRTQRRAAAASPRMVKIAEVIDGGNALLEAGGEGQESIAANDQSRVNEPESMTDFMPLVAGAAATTPLESGQLVRVQVPRSALAALGLPLNAARENERIKADVLLGADGVAHAIRFVH